MSYSTRTKDDPGDVARAADQQQSIDNEEFLYASVHGNTPENMPPGIVKAFIHKDDITDNAITEVFTITTTNETGANDGGVYACYFEGLVAHEGSEDSDNSAIACKYAFSRAMDQDGAGSTGAVTTVYATAVGNSDVGAKTISSITVTTAETSEYVTSVRFQINLAGTAVTHAHVDGMVTITYEGFLTAPVITSAD